MTNRTTILKHMISCKTLATSIPQILPNKQIKEQIHKWQQLNKINLEIGNFSRQNFGNVITSKGMCHVINHLQHRTSKFHKWQQLNKINLEIGNVSRQNFGNVITSKGMCHVINHLQHRTSKFHSLAVKESIQLPIQTTM